MNAHALLLVAAVVLAYGLVSRRLEGSVLTAPMIFAGAGLLLSPNGLDVLAVDISEGLLHTLSEVTLVVILFGDAARIDLRRLKKEAGLPVRLLMIGMPLTIVAGAAVGAWLLPDLSIWEVAVLAAVLAPTDAALGQAVVGSEVVPLRIRQALNVESGLNDGIAVPFVTVFAVFGATAAGVAVEATSTREHVMFTLQQIGLGPLAGIVVAAIAARLLTRASERGWMSDSHERIAGLATAALAYTAAEAVGGNGFIAAFVGGLVLGNTARGYCRCVYEFLEAEGQLLMLLVFFALGLNFAWPALMHGSVEMWIYAALSLTLIRIVPVAISMIGTGLRPPSLLFLGWFGPRGLASVVFAVVVVDQTQLPHREEVFCVAMLTVLMSVIVHGVTAAPGAKLYGGIMNRRDDAHAEAKQVHAHPLRTGHRRSK